jgi:hypothetical protein
MARLTIILFVDALGSVVADSHGFLSDRPASRHPLTTVIGYSSSAIPTLLTGRWPVEHGHFSMYRKDQGDGVFAGYRPLMLLAHHTRGRGKLRALLKRRLSRRVRGYFELYDLPLDVLAEFDLVQRTDIWSPGGLAPHPTFLDVAHEADVPSRVWTYRVPEETAYDELLADVAAGGTGFRLLYTAALDARMHREGTRSAGVSAHLARYAEWLDSLRQAARDRELHLFVLSDHGMVDIVGRHDIHGPLARTGLDAPRDYLVFTDSTMARFWFRKDGAEAAIRAALPDVGWARWLSDADLHRYGIDFPRREYGEAIYLLEPGHVIEPSFMGEVAPAAMHGYGPDDDGSNAWLLAEPPLTTPPATIRDLKALFESEVAWLTGDRR